ncbi:integrase catalytic domain-containing protein [Trichonephila clavipes]|uniref:Integrase catalytic domain-containing protein n=1 Tax=Trichonephila clavipes TaxID=2585209 RepID=A0A8X6RLF5_TRICX|nr:integrase catalytic domain-containing protein [Trichonephila clavipes]
MTPLASDVKSPHYFLPHHGVINDNSTTTKLRVVFDGSFKSTNGNSLNGILLTRKNYITYGTSCASFLAIRTLKQLCEDEKHCFPQAAKLSKDHFYVDDLLADADSLDSSRKIVHELQNLMSAGGFELRKCVWQVLSDLPNTLKTNISSHSFDDESTQKILGLFWDLNEDSFKVRAVLSDQVSTKRQMLSIIAHIFDPLGFVSPSTIILKIILQDLWKAGLDWDDEISSDILNRWNRFQAEISCLKQIKVPRVNFHAGQELVLSLIRQKFWIPHGKSAVKKELRNCIDCFKLVAKPVSQMMGDLPIERINPCHAFQKVGIDFAGPITTKCQHTRKANNFKSYICLFICMCTKAVHLELVSSLSAAAFMSALRRFVSRRSYTSDIYSDNGTNFVGASAYLKDLFQLLHNSNVHDYSSSKNIQWHFIPPYAPNFGGVWEASVKLTKQHLLKTLKAAVLNFEELDTILCQIEACIISRPLYSLSSDPKDLQVLTPGHFLTGCPLLELPDHSLTNQSLSIHSRWSLLMKLKRMFCSRWQLSYLNTLQSRIKWMQGQKDLMVGSLVLIKNPASFSTRWTPGRIVATHPGAYGICRVVTIQTSSGVMTRPVSQVADLPLPPSTTTSPPRRMLRTVDSFRRPEMAPGTGTFFILEGFIIGGKNAIRFVYVGDGSIVFFVIVLCNVFLHVMMCLCVLLQNIDWKSSLRVSQ